MKKTTTESRNELDSKGSSCLAREIVMQLSKYFYLFLVVVSNLIAGCTPQGGNEGGKEVSAGAVFSSAGWSEVQIAPDRFLSAPVPAWVKLIELPLKGETAPVYLPLRDTQYRIDENKKVDRYDHIAYGGTDEVQTQPFGQQSIEFDPSYQRVVLHAVNIWRAGQRIDVSARIKPRFLTGDQARNTVFSGRVSALLQIPDFHAGDLLELAWTVSGMNPVFSDHPWTADDWSMSVPIWKRHLSYTWPENLVMLESQVPNDVLAYSQTASMHREERIKDGWRHLEFSESNLPALIIEDNAALGVLQNDLVTMTSFRGWEGVSAWASALFDGTAEPKSPAYSALVAELLKLPTPGERAAGALHWVQREIRYVSMSLGLNSHRPHSPDEVIERRYGDCKDTALLLVKLPRALGIDAQPALMASFNSRLAPRLDAVPLFDHVLAVTWINGRAHVLDGTLRGQSAKLEHLAPWHGGADVFVVSGPNAGFLRVPYATADDEISVERTERMVIAEDAQSGTLTIDVNLRGVAAEKQRNDLRATTREVSKRQILEEIRRLYSNADWAEEPEVNDDEDSNRIVMHGVFKVPTPLKRSGRNLRHEYSDYEVTNRLPSVGDGKRQVPLWLPLGIKRVVFTHALDVPENVRIDEDPFEEKIESPAFFARIQRQRPSATRVIDQEELILLKDTIPTTEISAYQSAVRQVVDFETAIKLH